MFKIWVLKYLDILKKQMEDKSKDLNEFDGFCTGREAVKAVVDEGLSKLESEDNLKLFARRIGSDWKAAESSASPRILAFGDFEKAIAHKKNDIEAYLKSIQDVDDKSE